MSKLPEPQETKFIALDEAKEEWEATGVLIHAYTRAQAIDDGVLVDVSSTAAEAGFRWPVALTRTVWVDAVEWCEADSDRQIYQDEAGRLWDVLWMAYLAARRKSGESETLFQVYRVPHGGRDIRSRLVTLKMVSGPGDNGEPVITIMQPDED